MLTCNFIAVKQTLTLLHGEISYWAALPVAANVSVSNLPLPLHSFCRRSLMMRNWLGSISIVTSQSSFAVKSSSTFSAPSSSFSFNLSLSAMGIDTLTLILALWIGNFDSVWRILMHSDTWLFAFLFCLTLKPASVIAFSIIPTGYGRWVAGSTDFSATRVAISLRSEVRSWSRSFSPTWTSPLLRIFFDDLLHVCLAKCLLQVIRFRDFTFGHIHKDVADLEHIIQARFDASPPFLDFVLITCDLESFSAFLQTDNRNVC